jgi:hypothetical protein
MKRKTKPCVALCDDGSRCSQPTKDASQLCHRHLAQQRGDPANGGRLDSYQAPQRTAKEIIQRAMNSSDIALSLRAAEKWLEYYGKEQPPVLTHDLDVLSPKMTPDELEALVDAWKAAEDLQAKITRRINGEPEPPTAVMPQPTQVVQSSPTPEPEPITEPEPDTPVTPKPVKTDAHGNILMTADEHRATDPRNLCDHVTERRIPVTPGPTTRLGFRDYLMDLADRDE